MNTLLGYGAYFKSMEDFNPLPLFDLLSFSYEEISKEELAKLPQEDLWDILTYSAGMTLVGVLQALGGQSSLVEYRYSGVSHSLVYTPKMSWDVSREHRNIQPSDVHDEILFLLKGLIKDPSAIAFQHIHTEEL